jgi:hypothetical protein
MRYVVGYRGFQIIREGENKYFLIYRNDKLVCNVKFYSFADARRECDYLR